MNFYQVLNVGEQASQEEIRTAYLHLARENHPDRHVGELSGEVRGRFKKIQEAYEVLYDPAQRQAYDAKRIPQPRQRQTSATAARSGRTQVRPINPARRRDVPDDWIRRGRTKRKRPVLITVFIVGIVSLATMVVPRCSDFVQQRFEVIEIPDEKPLPGPVASSEPMMLSANAANGMEQVDAKIAEALWDTEGTASKDPLHRDSSNVSAGVARLDDRLDASPPPEGLPLSSFDEMLKALPRIPDLPRIDLSAWNFEADHTTPTHAGHALMPSMPVAPLPLASSNGWLERAGVSSPSVFDGLDSLTPPVSDPFFAWSGTTPPSMNDAQASIGQLIGGPGFGMTELRHPNSYQTLQTQTFESQLQPSFVGQLPVMPLSEASIPPIQRLQPPGAPPPQIVSMAMDQNETMPIDGPDSANPGFGQSWSEGGWGKSGLEKFHVVPYREPDGFNIGTPPVLDEQRFPPILGLPR